MDKNQVVAKPTIEQARYFFGIEDSTWAQLLPEEKLTYVDEIMDTPKFKRAFFENK